MTNDLRQRPTLGVWTTAFNYLALMVGVDGAECCCAMRRHPIIVAFLTAACNITLIAAAIGTLAGMLGVSADKPEKLYTKKAEPLKMADIVEVLTQ